MLPTDSLVRSSHRGRVRQRLRMYVAMAARLTSPAERKDKQRPSSTDDVGGTQRLQAGAFASLRPVVTNEQGVTENTCSRRQKVRTDQSENPLRASPSVIVRCPFLFDLDKIEH
uniref:Uncharacterized protein n=1 Tax=Steinernema glaseri TaxID=37863 RepID=A0A1I7YM34_9BILA